MVLAIGCGLLATTQAPWLAELQAQSYFRFLGRAEKLGTQNAKVTIEREFTFTGNLGDLRNTQVSINSLINEAGLELIAGNELPILLSPSRGGKPDEVIFRTADRTRPQVRMELKRREKGRYTIRLVVEFADSIPAGLCWGKPQTTDLTTSVTIFAPTASVGVTTTQPWVCKAGGTDLRI
jgi:hypothetical protein